MSQSEQFREKLDIEAEHARPGRADRRRLGWANAIVAAEPVIIPTTLPELEPDPVQLDDHQAQPLRGIFLAVLLSLPLWALIAAICLI